MGYRLFWLGEIWVRGKARANERKGMPVISLCVVGLGWKGIRVGSLEV